MEDVGGGNGFISPFGIIRHSRDQGHGHGGIDVPLKTEAPIYAVADGTINAGLTLDTASREALLGYFDALRTTQAFMAQWEGASEEGMRALKALLDSERFPEGPQLCYPFGLDVRTPG